MGDRGRFMASVIVAAAVAVGGILAGFLTEQGTNPASASVGNAYVRGALSVDTGPYLTDSSGRIVFLRGVNAVYKRAPYELTVAPGKTWNFSASDAARLASLGFNVVRLGIIWEGLEPGTLGPNSPTVCSPGTPGNPHQYNAAIVARYLGQVDRTVDLLGRYHIYTLLDMHEDVYSSEFGGEGAPAWAVCTDGYPIGHLPGRWSNTYNDPGLVTAVKHFWTNDVTGDLQGEYIRVWTAVATYFRRNSWVVGFDPINEPFTKTLQTGTVSGSPEVAARLECLYTGAAHPGRSIVDGSVLTCPTDDPATGLIRAFRTAAPTKLVFFEPDIYSSNDHRNDIGPMDYRNLVFNFHDYCGLRSGVTGNPTDIAACADQELRTMQYRSQERPDIASTEQPEGPAWFMSEFGATSSNDLMERLTSVADDLQLGWTYWAWKYYDDPTGSAAEGLVLPDGTYAPVVSSLSRAYPQAVAGTPVSFSFDPDADEFHMVYVPTPGAPAPTVIFLPVAVHYPDGYLAQVVGGTVVSKPDADHLVIAADHDALSVSVTVTALN